MTGMDIMASMRRICTSSYPSAYPNGKVENFLYPYSYPVNMRISRQNGDELEQYPRNEFICH